MANISAIKLPDGVTYDIVDKVSKDVFIAEYGVTTYNEIVSAISQKKVVLCHAKNALDPDLDYYFVLSDYDGVALPSVYTFVRTVVDSYTVSFQYVTCDTSNEWDIGSRNLVPVTRTVNGKALSQNITLDASDVGAQVPLVSGTNIKTINNESLLGSGNIDIQNVWYGTCSTTSSIQQKSVTTSSGDFALDEGNILLVEFASTNTYDGATLSVDKLTAKAIYVNGSPTNDHRWRAGEVVIFVYDGYHFNLIEQGMATTSYYGITKLSSSTSSTSELIAATPKAVKAAYDLANNATATPTASKKSKFDSDAHMNSTDMTTGSGGEVETFVNGLNVSGGGEIPSVTLTGSYNLKAVAYNRYGIITINIWQTAIASLPKGAWTLVGTLPSGYHPIQQVDTFGVDNNTSSVQNNSIQIRIGTDGGVRVWAYSNGVSSNQLLSTVTYVGGA